MLVVVGLGLGAAVVGVVIMIFIFILGACFSASFVVFALLVVIITVPALGAGVIVATFKVYCVIAHIAFPGFDVVFDSTCFLGICLAHWVQCSLIA